MSILIDSRTKVLVQGLTGRIGRFHAEEMITYGTQVVGGVTPGRGGQELLSLPVFDTMREGVAVTGATASIIFVPPPSAADAIMEAAAAGITYCVCITDGIPVRDMLRVKRYLGTQPEHRRMTLTGPNCAGTISPGAAMLGIMPGRIYRPGRVGVVGRSGTLGYEAAAQLTELGLGVSTSVGIGGDPILGMTFRDVLELFENDDQTEAVMMIGEIGGQLETHAAAYVHDHMSKPVVAYIAGLAAPAGRRMGHAGAIASAPGETAAEKVRILHDRGITIAPHPAAMGSTLARALRGTP